jgi:hypothetical protein
LAPLPADVVTPEPDEEDDEYRKPEEKDKALDVILSEAGNVLTDWIHADTAEQRLVDNDGRATASGKAGPTAAPARPAAAAEVH